MTLNWIFAAGNFANEKEVRRLIEEATRMRGFKHPNILCMIGLVFKDNRPMVVLPYMENGDLCQYVADESKVRVLQQKIA